jgi:hypothetical protein
MTKRASSEVRRVQVPEAVRDVDLWQDAVDHFAFCETVGLDPLHFAPVDEDHDFVYFRQRGGSTSRSCSRCIPS